jgi:Gram-negative bacterial TonB protein C-terminal
VDRPHCGRFSGFNFARGPLAPGTRDNQLSSAEDMSLETASPAATPSEPPVETHAAEPVEAEAPELNPTPPLKTNMVAQEVRVAATGVAPGKGTVERELFTEETTSVLVFESGGVIRLSAAVTPGQLLLLTNVETKREVVAQVKRKRAYKPLNCYVELEFAEPAPRFWGTEFSAAAAFLPKDAQDAQAAAMVTSAEATADEPGEPPAAPTIEEVEAFKREVGGRQGRPNLTQTAATSEHVQAAGDVPSTGQAANTRWEEISASASIGKSLPIKKDPAAAQWTTAEQALLPKPALDFSKSLPRARRTRRARGSFTPSFRGGALRLGLFLSALIVTVAGAAWSKHWLSSKRAPEKTAVGLMVVAAKEKSSPLPGSSVGAQVHSEINHARVTNEVPAASASMSAGRASLPNALPAEPKDAAEPSSQPLASDHSGARPAGKRTLQSSGLAENRSTLRPTANAASGPVAAAIGETGVVPPKLIKSVRALAPIEAVRDFETGNVVVDAVVGTAGEVNLVSVLSGPPSLRGPAIASLKEYRYEPATRNGQPVPAHVTITIHFRFEP